jgi:hypothetical protein
VRKRNFLGEHPAAGPPVHSRTTDPGGIHDSDHIADFVLDGVRLVAAFALAHAAAIEGDHKEMLRQQRGKPAPVRQAVR